MVFVRGPPSLGQAGYTLRVNKSSTMAAKHRKLYSIRQLGTQEIEQEEFSKRRFLYVQPAFSAIDEDDALATGKTEAPLSRRNANARVAPVKTPV